MHAVTPAAPVVATAPHAGCGCPGAPRELTRRTVLRGGVLVAAATAVAGVVGPDLFSSYAFAADAGYAGDVLVVLSLRGGMDGLGIVAPVHDEQYQSYRPSLAIPVSQAVQLSSTFGMHPAMAPLKPMYDAKSLGFVWDVGQASATRSHFEAMDALERAAPGSGLRTGWLDRALGARPLGTVFQGTQVGHTGVSPAWAGPFSEAAVAAVDGYGLDAGRINAAEQARWERALRAVHAGGRPDTAASATAALGVLDTLSGVKASKYVPANGAQYPTKPDGTMTGLAQSLADTARLVKAGVGLQVATVDWGDWDMHVGAGTPGQGWMNTKLTELSGALAAFHTDLGAAMSGVSVVTLSEFGRRVKENGSGGTDHGHGNLVMVMGGGTVGGTVHGQFTGLGPTTLADGALPGTTDYRQILGEILTRRCGARQLSAVFPGMTPAPVGVTVAR